MKCLLVVLSIVILALAACQAPPPPAPAATTVVQQPTRIATAAPTLAASPTTAPTTQPTLAPTAAPTAVPTEAPTVTPVPPPTSTPIVTRDVYVSADNGLNFRSEPKASAFLQGTLPTGTRLTAIGEATAPDASGVAWQNVRTGAGQTGWVAAQYLTSAAPAASTPPPPPTPEISGTPVVTPIAQPGYVYVASVNGLNLRADHSAAAALLATLANGQRLQTNGLGYGPDNDGITWINVKIDNGREGWVSAEFVNTQVPSVAPAAPPANVSDAAAELLRRTNNLRQQNGLSPLILDSGLTTLALAHSQYMAQNGITHIDAEGLSASKRIANAGYTGFPTENIYGGQASIDDAWEYWATDPPHLANLLNIRNTLIGIGVFQSGAATYYTQDFAQPRP